MADILGFCDPRFQSLRDLFESNLDTGLDEGASLAVTLNGIMVVDLWGGTRDLARTLPWEEDTPALVFSTGKVVVNIAVLMLWDRGLLDIDAPVATYWPEFGRNGKHAVTTRQVLTHQSGVPGFGRSVDFEEVLDWKHIVEVVEAAPLWFEPGSATCYSPVIYGFILGELVHRLTRRRFETFVTDEITGPVGAQFSFGVLPAAREELAELWVPASASARVMMSESGSRAYGEVVGTKLSPEFLGAVVPATNGVCNARALARIGSILAMAGEVGGHRYLGRHIVEQAAQEQNYAFDQALGWCRYGLGFGLDSAQFKAATPTSFHWGGFGGSGVTMDMATGLSLGFVPNRLIASDDLFEPRVSGLWQALGAISAGIKG